MFEGKYTKIQCKILTYTTKKWSGPEAGEIQEVKYQGPLESDAKNKKSQEGPEEK